MRSPCLAPRLVTLLLLVIAVPCRDGLAQGASSSAARAAVMRARIAAERHATAASADAALAAQLRTDPEGLRLARATMRRLRYDRPGAARDFEALRTTAESPAVRLQAALGLAELAASTFEPDARRLATAAAATAAALHDDATEAEARWIEARLESRTGRADSASALFRRAVLLAPRADDALRAGILCSQAQALRFADARRAAALVDEGLAAARRSPLRRRVGACLVVRAQVLETTGMGMQALPVSDSAIAELRAARDLEAEAGAWQVKSYLHSDFAAQPALARAAARTASRLGIASGNRLAAGWAELVLAQVAMRLAQPAQSWTHAATAERLLTPMQDRFGLSVVALVRAEVAHADGRLAQADSLYALQERRDANGPQRVLPRLRRAAIARQQGRLLAADSLLALVGDDVDRWKLAGYGTDRVYELGLLRLAEARWDEADALLARFAGFVTTYPDLRLAAASRRAVAAAGAGRFDDALLQLDEAARLLELRRARLFDRGERAAALRGQRIDFDANLGLPTLVDQFAKAGRFDAALQAADLHRARALNERAARRLAGSDDGGLELRTQPIGTGPEVRRRLASLPGKLPDDVVLLEYVVGGPREPSTLLVASRRGTLALPLQLPVDLDARVRRFSSALSADLPATVLGQELARAVLGPALPLLRESRVRRVAIVADGALHRLPFDALVLPDGRRLLELVEVTTLPSAQLLQRRPAATPLPNLPKVIAFGDPTFAPQAKLARLPATREESRGVAALDRGAILRLGADASESELRAMPLRAARVLHLATHAVVSEAGDDRTALHLAPGNGHDGRLGPDEIAALDLDTDLVVLSACRTAGGTVLPAEGLQGLVGPFLEAGTRNVLVTHWDVRDREMGPVMARVYQQLARGASVGEAVRAARLSALRAGLGPRQWAVLALVGDGAAVPLPSMVPPRVRASAARGALVMRPAGRPAGAP